MHATAWTSTIGAMLCAEARELRALIRAPVLGNSLGTEGGLKARSDLRQTWGHSTSNGRLYLAPKTSSI
eukprot:scaffold11341_cov28-Tisochrysis_lutea.AAC.3